MPDPTTILVVMLTNPSVTVCRWLISSCPAGITAKVQQTSQGVDVQLVSDGSGAGRGGGDRKDVLPPLMPGLPARQQQ